MYCNYIGDLNEMLKNFIISFLIVTNLITAAFGFRLNHQLGQSRQLVEHYRVEFNAAKDRESDIAESIRRTGEILDSSISTVAELRNAIGEIRRNYEEMASRMHNAGDGHDSNNNIIDNSDEEQIND